MKQAKIFAAIGLGLLVSAAWAQQPASVAGTGTVTGHVTCGDTQRPARFASVILFGVPADAPAIAKMDENADPKAVMAAMKDVFGAMGKASMVSSVTDANGAFAAQDVPPGDYYVFASAAGYVQPFNQIQAAIRDGADPHKRLPGIQIVHVAGEHTTNVEASMVRGAAVSGTVQFDDGTPVTGAHVAVMPAKKDDDQTALLQFAMMAAASGGAGLLPQATDDLGHFRISGLVPGDYYVMVTSVTKNPLTMNGGSMNLSRMMGDKPLVFYAPSVFHRSDAELFTLHAAEDKRDVAVTLNLNGLHTVSGRIASAEDHHGVNAATISVTDPKDKDFVRSASVDAAGNFTVPFVPPGTYEVKVSDAGDTEPAKKTDNKDAGFIRFAEEHTLKSYDDKSQSLIVSDSDVAGVNMELVPSKEVRQPPNMNDVMSILGGKPKD
jgi:Carboxypeptidase regulatory-like domain